jgi:hypothetical protein
MTPFRVSVFAVIASLVLLVVILELIRTRRLRERYSLLWLLTGIVMLVLSAWRDGLGTVSDALGISYPPSTLFVLGLLFILVVLLHYSTVMSRLSDQSTILAQRLALVEAKLEESSDRGSEGAFKRQAQ